MKVKMKRLKAAAPNRSTALWQTLELTKYEARVLACETENLLSMANGDTSGSIIGSANIAIEIID